MLEIIRSDHLPDGNGKVASFVFHDPDLGHTTENTYCVGVKLIDENNPGNPASWTYDHCNYWNWDRDGECNTDGEPVERAKLDEVLARHRSSFNAMLLQFISKF